MRLSTAGAAVDFIRNKRRRGRECTREQIAYHLFAAEASSNSGMESSLGMCQVRCSRRVMSREQVMRFCGVTV